MDTNILDKIIKPGDCILAFGIPTLKDDFYNDLESENKDFARTIVGGWPQYKNTIIKDIHNVEPVMKELGVNIIHGLTLKDFGRLFRENKNKIIILFTHWKEGTKRLDLPEYLREMEISTYLEMLKRANTSKVEFFDGLKSLYEIVEQIPPDFKCFLDLNVCQCEDLTLVLRKCRPNCHFKYKSDNPETGKRLGVKPDIMLYFYKILFSHLKRKNLNYPAALKEVAIQVLKQCKK